MGGVRQPESRSDLTQVGNVIFGADRQISAWVAERIPGFNLSPDARALGVIKGGQIVAGVVFEHWNGVHVEAAIAALPRSGWADRRTMRHLFSYPFRTLGCEAISASVASSNLPSLNLTTKMGFVPEAIIKYAAHDGSSLVVLKMFREHCKWIGENGQKRRQRARTP